MPVCQVEITFIDGLMVIYSLFINLMISRQSMIVRNARTVERIFFLRCFMVNIVKLKMVEFKSDLLTHKKPLIGLKIKLLDIGVGSLVYNKVKRMCKISRSCVRIKQNTIDFPNIFSSEARRQFLKPKLF